MVLMCSFSLHYVINEVRVLGLPTASPVAAGSFARQL
jgi:hypothetical protein